MPKGEKVWAQSKRTAPPPYFLKLMIFIGKFQIGISCVLKREKVALFKVDILKPSWTLKGEFIEGEFCLVKGKSIWNKGRKFQILKMLFKKSYSFTFDYLAKWLWKEFTKEFAKTKLVVQGWSKMLKIKKQSMHI
jgi:hypothetical protein